MSQERTQEKRVRQTYCCSFCDKTQDQVERLIAGPRGVYICDQCIELCNRIIRGEREQQKQAE